MLSQKGCTTNVQFEFRLPAVLSKPPPSLTATRSSRTVLRNHGTPLLCNHDFEYRLQLHPNTFEVQSVSGDWDGTQLGSPITILADLVIRN